MTTDQIRAAAEFLLSAWTEERLVEAVPQSCQPATRADGYVIQAKAAELSGQPTVGWKIAATSIAGQKHLNIDGPLAGRLLANRVHSNGAAIPFGNNAMRVAEAEFAFRFAQDLPPRNEPYTVDEVLSAVATLHPAIEIPDSRYVDFCKVGPPQLIADQACAHHFVLGDATAADWRSVDLKMHVVQARHNDDPIREGIGGNVLGDPRFALTWLVNELRAIGIPIRANDIVTTGTSIVPLPISQGSRIVADFGAFGIVRTSLS